jgi:sec-independent protein translocase protein TatA
MEMLLLFTLGGTEWIVILLAVVLLFGGKKIPELMRGLGKGIKEFNDAKTSVKSELNEGMRSEVPTAKKVDTMIEREAE